MRSTLIRLLISLVFVLISKDCHAIPECESEFNLGKATQRHVIDLATQPDKSPLTVEQNLDNPKFWNAIREGFIKAKLNQGETFTAWLALVRASNAHFKTSASLRPDFPSPWFYMGINYCIGGSVVQAEQCCSQLRLLEMQNRILPPNQLTPRLNDLIQIHHRLIGERAQRLEDAMNLFHYHERISTGIAVFLMLFGRDLVMHELGDIGCTLLGSGWGTLFQAGIEVRFLIPYFTALIEPIIVFVITKRSLESLFGFGATFYSGVHKF